MKKFGFIVVIAAILAVTISCASFQPVGMNDSFPQDCVVLGRVVYEADVSNAGYTKLIEQAQKEFPDAQDVVHIMVDTKKQFGKTKYVMSGIAIKYTK